MGTTEAELKREAATQRQQMGNTLEAIGDRLSPERMVERRKAAVGQKFRNVRNTVMGSPGYREPVTQRAREHAQDAAHSASETARSAVEKVQQTPEMLADQTRGNPIAAGVIAFGAGMLLASLFPETEAEQHLMAEARPQVEHATAELRETGRELADDMKERGTEAMEQIKSTGSDAASSVADQAKQSAQQVSQQARSETP